MTVYQYALSVSPDEIFEAAIVHDIMQQKNRRLFRLLGSYVPSGQMIFTLQPLEDTVTVETSYKNQPCVITIDKSTETTVSLNNSGFINSQNSVAQALLNILFKQAFRQTHLKQIGRDPRFFDYERPIIDPMLTKMKLQVLRGFKASVFMSESGPTVAVDTLFRFMSTVTCLDKIKELRKHARDNG